MCAHMRHQISECVAYLLHEEETHILVPNPCLGIAVCRGNYKAQLGHVADLIPFLLVLIPPALENLDLGYPWQGMYSVCDTMTTCTENCEVVGFHLTIAT